MRGFYIVPIIIGLLSLYAYFYLQSHEAIELLFAFIKIRGLDFQLGLNIDTISSISGCVVSLITLVAYIYSAYYMREEKSTLRYYGLLNIFYLGILSFLFSPNLFQMFIFWEIISCISYLLVGYHYDRDSVSVDAKRVFLINILGDITFFAGFIILSDIVCTLTNNWGMVSINFSDYSKILPLFISYVDTNMYSAVCLLFVISAFIKSAQFPINSWLINAMSAPTPVSALIHSSTLVMMGAYLLIRLYPMLIYSTIAMIVILFIGIFTAFLTSFSAVVQTNIKKVLAYSTSSQLGLVFIAIGLYKPIVAFIYLIIHGFIKSLLFFASGVVIKETGTKNILFMGGLRKLYPIAAISFLIGAIALSGIGFCGFSIKSMMTNVICSNHISTMIFGFLGILTAIYIFRLYFLVFEGEQIGDKYVENSHLPSFSLVVMSAFVVVLTFLLPQARICPLYILNIIAIGVAYVFYNTKFKLKKVPVIYQIFLNGFFINKIYYWGEVYLYKYFSAFISFIDKIGFGLIFNKMYKSISNFEYKMQTNNFQSYIGYGVWSLVVVLVLFTGVYLFILNYFGV